MDLSEFDPSLVNLASPSQTRATFSNSLYKIEKCQVSKRLCVVGMRQATMETQGPVEMLDYQ